MILWIAFIVIAFVLGVATAMDVDYTDQGIRAGVAIEGNAIIGWLFNSQHETIKQDMLGATFVDAIWSAPAILALAFKSVTWFIPGATIMGVLIAKRFIAVGKWKKLLATRHTPVVK